MLLPLFPLDVVLFPGSPLPLHIFEPRYKEMIGECLTDNTPFGVVRVHEQALAKIGCTAEIVTVIAKHSDGRFDIVTEGRNRFEILEVNQKRSYLLGEVLMLEDEPRVAAANVRERAIQLHAQILTMAGAVQDLSAIGEARLSFYLASSLPLDLDFKQRLLGLPSESRRVDALIEYLEAVIPNLNRASRAREKARGNGHIH